MLSLESFYETPRAQVAEKVRAVLAFSAIRVVDDELLLRTVEVTRAIALTSATPT